MGLGVWTVGGTDTYKLTDHNNLVFYWEQKSDVEKNTSEIYWEVRLTSDAYGYISSSTTKTLSMRLGLGSYHYNVNLAIANNTQKLLASDTISVRHELDGTGSLAYTIYLAANIDFAGVHIGNVTFYGDCILETIPRGSNVSVSGSTIIGKELKFNLIRYNSYSEDTITYEFGSKTGTIAKETQETAITWTIPESFYDELKSTETQKECKFTIKTYTPNFGITGTTVITKTITVDSEVCVPIIPEIKFYDINPTTVALTNDNDKIIKEHNTVHCYVKATARKGAYLTSVIIENNGKTLLSARDLNSINAIIEKDFENLSDGNIIIKATDTRGFVTRAAYYIKTIDYVKLTCSIYDSVFNEETGTVNIRVGGKYFNGIFDTDYPHEGRNNQLCIQYKYRLNSEDYPTEWTTAYDGIGQDILDGYNSYSQDIAITNLDPKYAYYVQIRAYDALTDVTLEERSLTITPIFNWGKEDFQFNVRANCDKGLSVEGQPVADFVVASGTAEMGTNGTWYWQKWNSGRSECYGCRNYGNAAVTTAWGVLYRSEVFNQDLPSGVFLNMPDVVDISFRNSNFGAWIAKHEQAAPSETTTGSFIIVRPASATLSQAKISFNVIGRWK